MAAAEAAVRPAPAPVRAGGDAASGAPSAEPRDASRDPAAAPPAAVRGSIQRRLMLSLGLLFLAAMALLFVAARGYGRQATDLSYDRLLAASALAMGETVTAAGGRWSMDLPYAALDALAMAPDDRVFYSLRTPEGALVTGYGDLPAPPEALWRRARRAPEAPRGAGPQDGARDEPPVFFDAPYHGETVRFALVGHWVAGAPGEGRAWLQVGQTRRARDALAARITGAATAAIALLTVAALGLCWWSVRHALAPLARFEAELAARDAADLRPIATPVPGELALAVGALNRFIGRLAANLDTLRVFIAEAAHQMRTPLATLRAQAQLALDEDDPLEQRRSLVAIERNAARLTRLLNQLLADASTAHRGSLQRFDTVDLARILREALRDAVPRADPQPAVRLRCAVESAPLRGDALMLGEAIKNLVDNALKHGVARGDDPDAVAELDIALRPAPADAPAPEDGVPDAVPRTDAGMDAGTGAGPGTDAGAGAGMGPGAAPDPMPSPAPGAGASGGWELTVADRGPGIAAQDAAAVFERFARGRTAAGGAGLGMAIVRRVVDSHGGRIALEPRAGGGLVVRLWLPAGGVPRASGAASAPAGPGPEPRAGAVRPAAAHRAGAADGDGDGDGDRDRDRVVAGAGAGAGADADADADAGARGVRSSAPTGGSPAGGIPPAGGGRA
ncbi:MAG: sensor histidine kinase [Xylophilus ampelinus]